MPIPRYCRHCLGWLDEREREFCSTAPCIEAARTLAMVNGARSTSSAADALSAKIEREMQQRATADRLDVDVITREMVDDATRRLRDEPTKPFVGDEFTTDHIKRAIRQLEDANREDENRGYIIGSRAHAALRLHLACGDELDAVVKCLFGHYERWGRTDHQFRVDVEEANNWGLDPLRGWAMAVIEGSKGPHAPLFPVAVTTTTTIGAGAFEEP